MYYNMYLSAGPELSIEHRGPEFAMNHGALANIGVNSGNQASSTGTTKAASLPQRLLW